MRPERIGSFPAPGDMIGRFRVLAQLGAGDMGVVYDALEVNLDRRVALKVISPMFADDADFQAPPADQTIEVPADGEG